MNKPAATFVTCRCQYCDNSIEFDASAFDKGETRTASCPHCGLETVLFVPPSSVPTEPPKLNSIPPAIKAPQAVVAPKPPKSFLEIVSILCMVGFLSWTVLCACGVGFGVFAMILNEGQNPAITSNNQYEQAGAAVGMFFGLGLWLIIWLLGAIPTFLIWFMTRKR